MRLETIVLCFSLAGCSSVSENATSPGVVRPPDQKVADGANAAVVESHLEPPLEISDLMRSPPNYTPPWMICLRSTRPKSRSD